MRRRIVTLALAAALAISAVGSAGAYWTADPGPNPARCGMWAAIASNPAYSDATRAQAQGYFDHYNCVWVS